MLLARSLTLLETVAASLSSSLTKSAPMMCEYDSKSRSIFSWSRFFSTLSSLPPPARSLRLRSSLRLVLRLLDASLSISSSITAMICAVLTPPHFRPLDFLGPKAARPDPAASSPAMKPAS